MNNNKSTVLITGANGEVGHGLIEKLKKFYAKEVGNIIALDLNDLDPILKDKVDIFIKGSVTDANLINKIFSDYNIQIVYHLAAILSTGGEKSPELAHEVNVNGTHNLLSNSNKNATEKNESIKFVFPSTIAVYGMKNLKEKTEVKRPKENEFLYPITMYGINKLYCENLGVYFSANYQLLTTNYYRGVDFRCVRFPGLISADTTPSGGTSDYAPEMLHYAVQNKNYECFVRPDSVIHFMAMPDAIDALLQISEVQKNYLSQRIYNIRGFSASASEIENIVKKHFPNANISYKVNPERQKIIDSWSEDVDDSLAVNDWGWKAKYDFKKAFEEYLVPSIQRKYHEI